MNENTENIIFRSIFIFMWLVTIVVGLVVYVNAITIYPDDIVAQTMHMLGYGMFVFGVVMISWFLWYGKV